MGIVSWLRERTPTVSHEISIETLPIDPRTGAQVEIRDSANDDAELPDTHYGQIALEPIFIVMEYRSATGEITRRPVTFRTLHLEKSHPALMAICHMRKAVRLFRLDRIQCFIDADGLILQPAEFLGEMLGRDIQIVHETDMPRTVSPYTALRRELAPALVLLSAAARADLLLVPEEVDRIMLYCENEALHLHRDATISTFPELSEFDRLGRTIRRTRPTLEDLDAALISVSAWADQRMARLMRALEAVIMADGIVTDSEIAFRYEIQEHLRVLKA